MSGSWAWAVIGSLKKITKSMSWETIKDPICWSPPSGPDANLLTLSSVSSSILFPVVPVTPGSGLGVTGEKANRTVQILRSTERKFAFWLTHHI